MNPATLRIRRLLLVLIALHVLVLARIFAMQVVQGGEWRAKADRQQFRTKRLMPRRGAILDRAGRSLATEEPGYDVEIRTDRVDGRVWRCSRCLRTVTLRPTTQIISCKGCGAPKEAFVELTVPRPERYDRIAELLEIPPERVQADIEATLAAFEARPESDLRAADPVYRNVSLEVARILHLEPHRCPELRVTASRTRVVHHPETMAYVVGRAGRAYREHIEVLKPLGFEKGDVRRAIVGRSGVEEALNDRLMGRMGVQFLQTDHASVVVEVLEDEPPQHGEDIRLTIDLDLQRAAEAILDSTGLPGGFAAIDPRNGEILALATTPRVSLETYRDPVAFQAAQNDPRKPFTNRAIEKAVIPGSVFKIVTALAALEETDLDPENRVLCTGAYHRIKCNATHGEVDLLEALERSCNVYFIHAGIGLGRARLEAFARRLGLGARIGLGLRETTGIVPRSDLARYPADLWFASFGQGPVGTSPLQMARISALVANGGRLVRPTLVLGEAEEPGPVLLKAETLRLVREGMRRVVHGRRGTARNKGLERFDAAAKTGTAEQKDRPNNAWLVGYAPYHAPRIAFACYVEDTPGHGGEICGPLVAQWLEAFEAWEKGR